MPSRIIGWRRLAIGAGSGPPGLGVRPMIGNADTPRDLLFGLLALQNGLIDQGALFSAFTTWTAQPRAVDGRDPPRARRS